MPAYIVLQESGKNIILGDDPVIFSLEWLQALGLKCKNVSAAHARIRRDSESVIMETLDGSTWVNGVSIAPSSTIKINHNDVIVLGHPKQGCIVIFKDEAQATRRMETSKVRAIGVELINKKNVAEKLSRDFFNRMPRSLSQFSKFLLDFLEQNFHINRGVVYRVDNKKWIPIVAKAPQNFVPPRYILDQVWETKEAKRFSTTEVEDPDDLSRSIVENKVCSSICFPMFHSDTLIGILYIDTLEDKEALTQEDLLLLSALMPGMEGVFSVLLYQETVRQQAATMILSLQRFDVDTNITCTAFDKQLQNFSIGKKGVDNSNNLIFCSFQNQTGGDFTTQLMLFAGLFSLIQTTEFVYSSGPLFLHKLDSYWCPQLRGKAICSIGIVSILGNSANFIGLEECNIVLKTKNKNSAFYSESRAKWGSGIKDKVNAESQFSGLTEETICVLSTTDPQTLVDYFDKKKTPIEFKDLLLKNSGGVVCKWTPIEEKKNPTPSK
jgi:hypothetical protein